MVEPLVAERAYSEQISYHDFQNPGEQNKRITFFSNKVDCVKNIHLKINLKRGFKTTCKIHERVMKVYK